MESFSQFQPGYEVGFIQEEFGDTIDAPICFIDQVYKLVDGGIAFTGLINKGLPEFMLG